MEITGLNFVGGERTGTGANRFRAVNPVNGETLPGEFAEASAVEVNQALQLAGAAAASPLLRSAGSRVDLLRRIGRGLESAADELIDRAGAETGLPSARLQGELARTVGQLRLFADLVEDGSWVDARIDRADPSRRPVPGPDLRRMLVPIGPVAVFGASNFPLAFSVAGGDTASALAAGNPVIVKAHPAHPGTSELVGSVIREAVLGAGLPEGTFSLLQGKEHRVGLTLVSHPVVRAVGFTGSLKGGRALFDAAARRPEPIPVFAEMGSVNPVFLLPETVQVKGDSIAEGLVRSFTLGVGQFCTNPGLVIGVNGPGWEAFLDTLKRMVEESKPGTMLHCGIQEAYEKGVEALSSAKGVRTLSRSRVSPRSGSAEGVPAVLIVDASEFLERPLLDEVFGPVTLVVACADRDQQREVAETLTGQLTGTIHGTEEELAEAGDLIDVLSERVGRLVFNGFPTGVEVCPSMHHGGPYPATTDSRSTSVGTAAILRFARPICFQEAPPAILPAELRSENPLGIWRLVDGEWTRDSLPSA